MLILSLHHRSGALGVVSTRSGRSESRTAPTSTARRSKRRSTPRQGTLEVEGASASRPEITLEERASTHDPGSKYPSHQQLDQGKNVQLEQKSTQHGHGRSEEAQQSQTGGRQKATSTGQLVRTTGVALADDGHLGANR